MQGPPPVPGFTVGRPIGSDDSSMWLATENTSGAVVTLRLVAAENPEVRRKVVGAVPVLRELEHPHLARVLDVVDTPAGVVLIYEAAEGGSLADIVARRGPLPPGEVVTACAPVAEALAETHPHTIIHGALTIDDIVFAADGRPMLSGLGIAQVGGFRAGGIPRGWVPAEVASGGEPGPPADVFGLATIVVVALTGHLPRQPLLLPGVTSTVEATLERAFDRMPIRRPDASVMVSTLYAIADPEPVDFPAPAVEDPTATSTGLLPVPPLPAPGLTPPPAGTPPSVGGFADDAASDDAADDVAAFMRRRTTSGRRARRTAGGAPGTTPGPASTGAPEPTGAPEATRPLQPMRPPEATPPFEATAAPHQPAAPTGGAPAPRHRPGTAPGRRPDLPPAGARELRQEPSRDEPARVHRAPEHDTEPEGRRAREAGPEPGRRTTHHASSTSRKSRTEDSARHHPPEVPTRTARAPRAPSKRDVSRLAMVFAVVLVLAGAALVALQMFGPDDAGIPGAGLGTPSAGAEAPAELCGGPQPAPTEAPPEVVDWTQEVQRLYSLRAQAFEQINAQLLCQVYSPTSTGLAGDAELLQSYSDEGIRPDGLVFEVVTAELVSQTGGRVVLEITDRMPAYTLVDEDGEVVEEKAAIPDQTWQAELVPIADDDSPTPTWRFG